MKINGRVWKFGDNISTDAIIPGKYKFDTLNMNELAQHVMEGARLGFYEEITKGDIIVAGENFGCGSSREQAPLVLKHAGIACVLTESFARIFYRNAINVGLPVMEMSNVTEKVEEGDELDVDVSTGRIRNKTKDIEYQAKELPQFMLDILNAGGLVNYIRKKGGF